MFACRPRELCNFFSPLSWHAEQMFLNNEAAWPVERTLLTTGMTAAGITSLHTGERVETPELRSIAYTAPERSLFMGSRGVCNSNPQPLPPNPDGAGISGLIPPLEKRLRICVIGSIWTYSSHTDHVRFYGFNQDQTRPGSGRRAFSLADQGEHRSRTGSSPATR